MSTIRIPRPSKGGRTVATRFFPERDGLLDELTVAARATGRRGLTIAFTLDGILEHARSQLPRAQRRRFDSKRQALAAEIVAAMPPEVQCAYELEPS